MSKTYNSSYNRLKLPSRTFDLIIPKKRGVDASEIFFTVNDAIKYILDVCCSLLATANC